MNEQSKQHLHRELRENQRFQEACDEIREHLKSLRYKRKRSAESDHKPDAQDWAYDTGWNDGIDYALNYLGFTNAR